MEITRMHKGPRMTQVVMHGDTMYLSGKTASDPTADTGGQTRDILGQIEALLAEAGSSKSRLLSATVYLADIRDFAAMNEVWDAWIDPNNPPARTTVQASLARPQIRIEITVIAAR